MPFSYDQRQPIEHPTVQLSLQREAFERISITLQLEARQFTV
jgi:hypothetical protein